MFFSSTFLVTRWLSRIFLKGHTYTHIKKKQTSRIVFLFLVFCEYMSCDAPPPPSPTNTTITTTITTGTTANVFSCPTPMAVVCVLVVSVTPRLLSCRFSTPWRNPWPCPWRSEISEIFWDFLRFDWTCETSKCIRNQNYGIFFVVTRSLIHSISRAFYTYTLSHSLISLFLFFWSHGTCPFRNIFLIC